jgi:hypothetical protein
MITNLICGFFNVKNDRKQTIWQNECDNLPYVSKMKVIG